MSNFVDGHRWPPQLPPVTPEDTPAGSETPSTAPDQQTWPGTPDSISALLHLPGVYVQADEDNAQVVIGLPADVARSVAVYAPDPLQVQLAARLIDAAVADLEDAR